jgi:hypothetical protein
MTTPLHTQQLFAQMLDEEIKAGEREKEAGERRARLLAALISSASNPPEDAQANHGKAQDSSSKGGKAKAPVVVQANSSNGRKAQGVPKALNGKANASPADAQAPPTEAQDPPEDSQDSSSKGGKAKAPVVVQTNSSKGGKAEVPPAYAEANRGKAKASSSNGGKAKASSEDANAPPTEAEAHDSEPETNFDCKNAHASTSENSAGNAAPSRAAASANARNPAPEHPTNSACTPTRKLNTLAPTSEHSAGNALTSAHNLDASELPASNKPNLYSSDSDDYDDDDFPNLVGSTKMQPNQKQQSQQPHQKQSHQKHATAATAAPAPAMRVTSGLKFKDVLGEDRSRSFQVSAFFSSLGGRSAIPSDKNHQYVPPSTDFCFEVSPETSKQAEYGRLLKLAKELRIKSTEITGKLAKAESDLKGLKTVKKSTLSPEQNSKKQRLVNETAEEIELLKKSLEDTRVDTRVNEIQIQKLGIVDMHPDTSNFNQLKSRITTSSSFPHQRDLFSKVECVFDSLEGSNAKLTQLGKTGPPFTYLSIDGTDFATKPHALLLSKYRVTRAVISGCLDKSLFAIDWETHRIIFTKPYSSNFPEDRIFHAFMVALWTWLDEKVKAFNKQKKKGSLMTLETALSSEDNAISVFASFLKKVKVAPGSEVERIKKARKTVKKILKSDANADDEEGNDSEGEGENSEEGEEGGDSDEESSVASSAKSFVARSAICRASGGGAVRTPPSSKKSAQQLAIQPREEPIHELFKKYQDAMFSHYNSQPVARASLGCNSVIPTEAFEAYQAIKKHSSVLDHLSVPDLLVENGIIIRVRETDTFTISSTE